MNHYVVMFIIMIAAGALSTMNVWAARWSDMRYSLNDAYMILLMSGWMILFMGLYYGDRIPAAIGALITVAALAAIRTQLFVNQEQYLLGMIPHHSMAVTMSRKLLEKGTQLTPFVQNIIDTQEKEITAMKTVLAATI
jgi:uncharacterized protein (DUF305 family)